MIFIQKTKETTMYRVILASISVLFFLPSISNASHYDGQCSTALNTLEISIQNADFRGKRAENTRSNLLTKLEAANAKITLLKYSDAVDKLGDISDEATKLAGAVKQKLSDATAINAAVASSISCTGALL
jgi:hypothetical protein